MTYAAGSGPLLQDLMAKQREEIMKEQHAEVLKLKQHSHKLGTLLEEERRLQKEFFYKYVNRCRTVLVVPPELWRGP